MTDTKKTVPLKVGEATLALAFTTEAQVAYEENMTCDFSSVPEFFANASSEDAKGRKKPVRLSVRTMRALLWAALSGGDNPVSMKRAGEIIDEAGHVPVLTALSEAVALAFGVEDKGEAGKPARETPPAKSTGKAPETPVPAS